MKGFQTGEEWIDTAFNEMEIHFASNGIDVKRVLQIAKSHLTEHYRQAKRTPVTETPPKDHRHFHLHLPPGYRLSMSGDVLSVEPAEKN